MKKATVLTAFALLIFLSGFAQDSSAPENIHPAWILRGSIYEVNVRQYTNAGTLNAFAQNLDRLKAMGVSTLWFMPLNPISKVDRKGTLGSYYAVSDYTALNPEFGTIEDWKRLVKLIHARGMKVIIDWVPNHTGADNRWLSEHPDFYVKDSSGKAKIAVDWADTRQLDYSNKEMQDSMIASMNWWLKGSDIDGFRCDVAWNIPGTFWRRCIADLKKVKNVFMLAEGDSAYLPQNGFDAIYPWHMFHKMVQVAAGERPALSLDSVLIADDNYYPAHTIEMYFTSNHDENSWNKADFGLFPGASHAPFAVLTQTMSHSVPLIYGGQEEPVLRPLAFFEKDPIVFGKYSRARFYKTLLALRKNSPALTPDAAFRKVNAGDSSAVYAYVREKGGEKILVILNLSKTAETITVSDKTLWGRPYNVFMGMNEPLSGKPWELQPWGFAVYKFAAGQY